MLLTKLLQKDYTKNSDGYQLKLPLNLETIIPDNDSVRLLSQFVEAMDLTDLYSTYERINSVSPRTLLKIVLYSYMNGDYLQGLEVSILLPVLNVSLQKCLMHCLIWEKFPERPFLLMVQKLKPVPISILSSGRRQ